MKIAEIMTKDFITISPEKTVQDAAKIMIEKNISVLPITNGDGELVGIITQSDFVGKEVDIPHALASIKQLFGQNFYFKDVEDIYEQAKTKAIKDVMSVHVKSLPSHSTVDDLVHTMIKNKLKRIPVVDNGVLVGIVTRKDLIKAFI